MDKNDPILAFTADMYLRRAATVAELNVIVEAARENERDFCADVWVAKDASEWWIWAISLFKLEFEDGLPTKRIIATVERDMAAFNGAFDRNAGIGMPAIVLLKRGRREKKYMTLSGLYSDCVEILGASTPIDLHIHGEPSEVGND